MKLVSSQVRILDSTISNNEAEVCNFRNSVITIVWLFKQQYSLSIDVVNFISQYLPAFLPLKTGYSAWLWIVI